MDDFVTAFFSRWADTRCLWKNGRKIASMHLGGLTIECLLKRICFSYHGITGWNQTSNITRRIIKNPRHRISNIIAITGSLQMRANADPQIMDAIKKVQEPCGRDYIIWRYQGIEPNQNDFDDWYKAYKLLLRWIINQSRTI